MAFMQLVVGVDDSHEHVVLQLNEGGATLGHVALDPASTADHIEAVARYRAQLKTPVPATLDPAGRIDAASDPAWMTLSTAHGPVLALRDPGLGWVSFLLPAAECRKMGAALMELADRAAG